MPHSSNVKYKVEKPLLDEFLSVDKWISVNDDMSFAPAKNTKTQDFREGMSRHTLQVPKTKQL